MTLGDIAVSNTIGNSVFDILVGLGIPWGLQTMVVNYGSTVSSSHFLSEMTLDLVLHRERRGVGPAAKSFRGGTAPVSSAGWQPLCTRHPRAAWGCLQRQPMFAGTHRCFGCEHPPVASRGGKREVGPEGQCAPRTDRP